jgi:hypothetical protein
MAIIALGTTTFVSTAQAATSTFIGNGGGTAGPVQLYGVSMLCEGPYPGASGYTGQVTFHGQSSAAANISYNFAWTLEIAYGNQWHSFWTSPTQRRSGSQLYLDSYVQIHNMDPNNRHYWQAFLWIQNPLTGNWFYAGAISNGTTNCYL